MKIRYIILLILSDLQTLVKVQAFLFALLPCVILFLPASFFITLVITIAIVWIISLLSYLLINKLIQTRS